VTVGHATGCLHVSLGRDEAASEHLLAELKIVAELAKAILPPNPKLDWDKWVADYRNIKDANVETYPEVFHDFNERM
jgi:hypothetical protein